MESNTALINPVSPFLLLTYEPVYGPREKGTTRNRKPTTKPKRRDYSPDKYISVNEIGRTVGIEVTFLPGGFEREDIVSVEQAERNGSIGNTLFSSMHTAYATAFDRRLKRQFPKVKERYTYRLGTDPECVEIATNPIKHRKVLRKTLDAYYSVAEGVNMVPNYPWHSGCGAHIHVGRKKDEHKDMDAAMYAFATAHPYITWAFITPGDGSKNARPHGFGITTRPEDRVSAANVENYRQSYKDACDELKRSPRSADAKYNVNYWRGQFQSTYKKYLKQKRQADKPQTYREIYKQCSEYTWGKGAAISRRTYGDHGTWEFRIFRAPDDVEGHMRQLDFAMAYVEYVEKLVKSGKDIPVTRFYTGDHHTKAIYHAYPLERSIAGFNKLLRTLGLDARKYKADIENMKKHYAIMGGPAEFPKTDITTPPEAKAKTPRLPVIVLPRRLSARKHRRGANPYAAPYVRLKRGLRRKLAIAMRAEAARVEAERLERLAQYAAAGRVGSDNLMQVIRVGDSVTVGPFYRTTIKGDFSHSVVSRINPEDTFYPIYIDERSFSPAGTYYHGEYTCRRILAVNGMEVVYPNDDDYAAEYYAEIEEAAHEENAMRNDRATMTALMSPEQTTQEAMEAEEAAIDEHLFALAS